jgi:predicted MPP superfamily phosphohydrolase
MKGMATEASATLMIVVLCWIVLTIADASVGLMLKLMLGIPFRKAFLWGLLSLLLPPLAIGYGALIERNCFRINEINISFENLPEGFDGYRIVHISDIHARSFIGREKHLARAIDKINGLDPDIVAFTGDLITLVPEEVDSISYILKETKARDGIYSILGNHDYGIYADRQSGNRSSIKENIGKLLEKEKEIGWNPLTNQAAVISRGTDSIAVVGVENTSASKHFPSRGRLDEASAGTEGLFRILLSHDPMHWDMEIRGKDYPLTLSGHTHAMQLSLLGWSPSSLIFKQNKGLYSSKGQYLYVNTGLGETIFPARIGARPEITLIILKKKDSRNQASVSLAR